MITATAFRNGLPPIETPVLARVGDDLLAMMLVQVNGALGWAVHAGRFACLLDPTNYEVAPDYEPQEWTAMPSLPAAAAPQLGDWLSAAERASIALGKYAAGFRPGDIGWTEHDQAALDEALGRTSGGADAATA